MKYRHGYLAACCLGMVAAFGASAADGSSAPHEVPIECRAKSNNDGCEKTAACPAGTTMRSATAACNLEHGLVTDEQLSLVERGYLEIVRRSDHSDEGRCWLGNTRIESGRVPIASIADEHGILFGCQEHDRNGGDCHMRGTLFCR